MKYVADGTTDIRKEILPVPLRVTDIAGNVYCGMKVLGFVGWNLEDSETGRSLWLVECHCGKLFKRIARNLLTGKKSSCGCLQLKTLLEMSKKHGERKSTTYTSHQAMKARCYNIKIKEYKEYGAMGVTVCARWLELAPQGFINFLEDMGDRPNGRSLNRIRGAKIYSKETCEWADGSVQGFDQKKRRTNTSGKTGVYYIKCKNTWLAKIGNKSLGSFKCFEDAVKVREEFELKYYGFTKE